MWRPSLLAVFIIRSIFRGPVYGLAPSIFPTCGTAQKQRGAGAEETVGELALALAALLGENFIRWDYCPRRYNFQLIPVG